MDTFLEDISEAKLKEEHVFCNLSFVDFEFEKRRHCVFTYTMSSFKNYFLNEKLHLVFNQLKSAAKVTLAFEIQLNGNEFVTCRYCYAHKNNTVLERSKLVCTQDDMVNLKEKLQQMHFVDHRTKKGLTLNGDFIILQMLQFLLPHSKIYPWVLKTLYHVDLFWKTTFWTVIRSRDTRENPTLTTSVCSISRFTFTRQR